MPGFLCRALTTVAASSVLAVTPVTATVTACSSAATLEELVVCFKDSSHMPRSGSNDLVLPNLTEQLDWAAVVEAMLDGSLTGSCPQSPLPATLDGLYELATFTDASDGESYCVLSELAAVGAAEKKSWGTFIVNLDPGRELAIQIPHPLNDLNTPEEGVGVFKTTRARSYLLTGSHRNANTAASTCQSSYKESDAAHDTRNMFQATTEALLAWYQLNQLDDELVVLQFHGMGSSTCPGVDAYMTYGRPPGDGTPQPGDSILDLESALEAQHPTWAVIVPGESPTCTLNATTNVQGRLLNGVDWASVCGTAATSYSGKFIHVEQKSAMRLPEDWVDPVAAAWTLDCAADEHFEAGAGGWVHSGASTCTTGDFIAGVPSEQSSSGGVVTQVGGDHTSSVPRTATGQAFYTAANTSNGSDDVDGGVCIAESPVYAVTADSEVSLWYFHGQAEAGDDPEGDYFLLEISTDGGSNYTTLASYGDEVVDAAWTEVTTTVTAGASVNFRVQVSDGTADGSLIEGGVDDVVICPSVPACTVDGDCDDGLYCNGAETCNADTCEAGTPPACDDGLFCNGLETCNEGSDSCDAGTAPCSGSQTCNESGDICEGSNPTLWMSFRSNTSVPGVGTVADEDIVSYDEITGTWAWEFDGSDAGLGGLEISALGVLPDGDLLLSFTQAGTVGGLSVDDSDIVQFTPTSMGSDTSGTFSLYFDGSDVSLTSSGEDVDAVELADDGRLIISTTGSFSGSGATGAPGAHFIFTGTLGSDTSGSFAQHFDGSDVGLGGNSSEDVDAAALTDGGNLLFSTSGNFSVTGLSGGDEDVAELAGTFGSSTSGTFTMRQDLTALGIDAGEDVGSLHLIE